MKKVIIDIFNDKAILNSDEKVKEVGKCSGELDAVIKALQQIKVPCKIKLNCDHPVLERLIPEIDKPLHDVNKLSEGYDKWQVLSLLMLMKKIRNISLT